MRIDTNDVVKYLLDEHALTVSAAKLHTAIEAMVPDREWMVVNGRTLMAMIEQLRQTCGCRPKAGDPPHSKRCPMFPFERPPADNIAVQVASRQRFDSLVESALRRTPR